MDAPLAGPSVRKPPWRWWKRLALEAVSVRLDAWWDPFTYLSSRSRIAV